MKRALAGLVLSLSLAVLAFGTGTFLGGRFLVEPGSGLAGPAEAIGYGVLAAVFALVLGIWMSTRMSWTTLSRTCGVIGVAALCLVAWVAVRVRQERARGDDASAMAVTPGAPTTVAEPPAPPLPPDLEGRPDSLIGLLAIPTLFDPPDGRQPATRMPLALHARAGTEMRASETVTDPARIEAREFAYEEKGAVVYAAFNGWYRVGLADGGRAWIRAGDAGDWHPVESLLPDALAYLTDAWDGTFRPAPSDDAPARKVRVWRPGEDEFAADVKEVRGVNGRLWLRVAVFDESPCEGGDPAVVDEGWIPAYAPGGRLTAWFWSRGC